MWWNFLEPWKQAKILSKNLEKHPKNGEKNLENLDIGKKIFGRHPGRALNARLKNFE